MNQSVRIVYDGKHFLIELSFFEQSVLGERFVCACVVSVQPITLMGEIIKKP